MEKILKSIPVEKIRRNPQQPRVNFDAEEISGLAASMETNGLIQPIVVEAGTDGSYVLHDGERRLRAAMLLRWAEIDAIVVSADADLTKDELLTRALVANLQRSDLSPIERARSCDQMRKMGLNGNQIALRLGKAVSVIYNDLLLIDLDPEIQDLIEANRLPTHAGVAHGLLSIDDREKRIRLARTFAMRKTPVARIIAICERLRQDMSDKTHALPRRRNHRAAAGGGWDVMEQIGELKIHWTGVADKARSTCRRCILYDDANPSTCRDCPLIEFLKSLAD